MTPDEIAFPMRARRIQHSGMRHHYEPLIVEQFRDILRNPLSSFWDIGANVGYYSWLVKSLRPEVAIEAFEPDPANAGLIRATMTRTRIEGVTLNTMALGDTVGQASFTFDDVSGLAGCVSESDRYSLAKTTYGCTRKGEVAVSTVDEMRKRPVSFMKIDVEGHEAAVVRGALATLAQDKPVVIIECLTETYPDVSQLFQRVGYSMEHTDGVHFLAHAS